MFAALKRLNIYQKEMYPIISRLLLGYLVFGEIYFIILLNHGIIDVKFGIQELVCGFTVFSFLFWLRIADDFKDYELDCRLFKERPLPSGRVTKKDLGIFITILIAITLVLNFIYMNNFLFCVLLYTYGSFMAVWFFLDCDFIRTGDIGLIALALYICADVQRGNRLIAILSLVKGTPLDGQGLDSGVRTAEISGARAIFAAAGRDFDNRLVTAIAAEGGVLDVDNRILNTNQVQVDGVIAGGVRTIHRTSSIVLKRAAGHGQFLDVGQVQGLLDIVLNRAVLQRQGQLRQVIADLLILCLDSKALCLVPVQRQVFHGELGRFLVGISCRAGDLTGQGEFQTDALNREIGTGGERHILCDVPQNLNGAGAVCLNCG